MILILIMTIIILLLTISTLFSSEIKFHTISGTVINELGKPIENVSVVVDSLNIGTVTDVTGYFSIRVDNSTWDVSFSHIGYEKIRKKLNASSIDIFKIILPTLPISNEGLVITSNRKETYFKNSPVITNVLSKNEINESSYSTIKELIAFAMPNIQSTHDNHGEEKIKIQGLDNKYTIFLIDGNRVSGEFAGNIDFSQFNLNNIKRVEVVRGGLSTAYGSGAMGGVVNIITDNNSNTNWVSINSFYDIPKIFSNDLGYGIKFKKMYYSGDLNYNTSDGYDLTPYDYNSGVTTSSIDKTLDEYYSYSISQNIRYFIDEKSSVNLNYKYYMKSIYKYKFNNDNKIYLQHELPKYKNETFGLSYSKLLSEISKISLNFQNEKYSKSYYYPYYNSNQLNESISFEKEMETTFLWSVPQTITSTVAYNTKLDKHNLLLGLDYLYQTYSSINILNKDNTDTLAYSIFGNNSTKTMNEISLFVLDNFRFNDIEINLGARITNHSKYKSKVSPSLSLMKIVNNLNYRFNFSHSYRFPSLKEMYYSYENHPAGFPVIGNENLNISTANYFSIAIESRNHINNSIEFYYNDVSNMISNTFVQDEDGDLVYQYYNKDIVLYGLNLSSLLKVSDKINFMSIYTFTDANSKYEDVMDGISAHSINLRLKYSPIKNWNILLSSKYNSNKKIDASLEDQNNNRTEIILPGYSISDVTITKYFNTRNYLKVGVKNIFDYIDENTNEGQQDFLSSYEPGRRYFISINLNFEK